MQVLPDEGNGHGIRLRSHGPVFRALLELYLYLGAGRKFMTILDVIHKARDQRLDRENNVACWEPRRK
jgi:hypothetical protein